MILTLHRVPLLHRLYSTLDAGKLNWYAGGGLSFGFYDAYYHQNTSVLGINAIGGVEFGFSKIPLAISGDFRPGFGMVFYSYSNTYLPYSKNLSPFFDWSINLGVRYCFGK
ncbi:MAG: hypothetical protein LBR36_07365 [Bacteroidales bacterium]|jgi:hypothetical protein|nr:hypothetical protein [Bacteroidales bacterium]